MKKLGNLLNEVKGEKAHREAVAMGLKYKGFGYWVDPSTGETKYKTENDQLVAVDPDVESEKAGPSRDAEMASGPGGNPMGAMGTGMQMQQPAGTLPQPGTLPLGAPNPGEEIAPKELEWEPGPDGSTCVDSDNPPAEVPEDSYVHTKNNLKWGAGPDGTNYTNIDYAQMIHDLRNPTMGAFMDRQNKMEEIQRGQQRTFLSTFMSEAPQAGSAADEARRQGLSYSGYGYWKDSSGRVVAQTQGDSLVMLDNQGGNTAATTDMGNPTGEASGMTPADKARSMGLVSNGSGGYTDQEGNVIARTVNNELVFYDSRAGGGAVSDGSGGAMLTQSSPSWVDPVTGLIVVPPGQPESPVEINAVPDPIPATPPAGYDAFIQQKKLQAYQQDAERREAEAIAAQQQAQQEAETGIKDVLNPPGLQFEDFIDEALSDLNDPERRAKQREAQRMAGADATPTVPTSEREKIDREVSQLPADKQDEARKRRTDAHFYRAQQDRDVVDASPRYHSDKDIRQIAREAFDDHKGRRDLQEKRIKKNFDPFVEALQRPDVSPELRNRLTSTFVNAARYGGFNNEGSSTLSKAQYQALLEREKRIKEAYSGEGGDGTTPNMEAVRKFHQEITDDSIPAEVIAAAAKAIPAHLRKAFTGGDLSFEEGFDQFIRQHENSGYTGLPLGMDNMQVEHFIDSSMRDRIAEQAKEEGRELTPEEQEMIQFIGSRDNQFW